jgi:hypothetical protein
MTELAVSYLLVMMVCTTTCQEITIITPHPSLMSCQEAGQSHREAVNYRCVMQHSIERGK